MTDHPSRSPAPSAHTAEHLISVRELVIMLVSLALGALAGVVAGYTCSAVNHAPLVVCLAAGLVSGVLVALTAARGLNKLLKP